MSTSADAETGEDKPPPRASLAGDRPIQSESQDALGRTGFANQIRREIETAPRDRTKASF